MARIRSSTATLLSAFTLFVGALLGASLFRLRRERPVEKRARWGPVRQNASPYNASAKSGRRFRAHLRSGYLNEFGSLASLVSLVMSLVMWCGGSPHRIVLPHEINTTVHREAARAEERPNKSQREVPKTASLVAEESSFAGTKKSGSFDGNPIGRNEAHSMAASTFRVPGRPIGNNEELQIRVKEEAQPNLISELANGERAQNIDNEIRATEGGEGLESGLGPTLANRGMEGRPMVRVKIGETYELLELNPGACGI